MATTEQPQTGPSKDDLKDPKRKILDIADVVASRHFIELNPIPAFYNVRYASQTPQQQASDPTSGPTSDPSKDPTSGQNTDPPGQVPEGALDDEVVEDVASDQASAEASKNGTRTCYTGPGPAPSSVPVGMREHEYEASVNPIPEIAIRPELARQDIQRGGHGTHVKPRDLYRKPISQLLDMFAQNILRVGEAMIDAATGYKTVRLNPETGEEVEVYDVPPDAKVGELILSRLMGKPEVYKEVEHTGERTNNVVIYVPDNGRVVSGKDGKPIQPPPTTDYRPPASNRPPIVLPNKDEAEPNPYEKYTDTADIIDEDYVKNMVDEEFAKATAAMHTDTSDSTNTSSENTGLPPESAGTVRPLKPLPFLDGNAFNVFDDDDEE